MQQLHDGLPASSCTAAALRLCGAPRPWGASTSGGRASEPQLLQLHAALLQTGSAGGVAHDALRTHWRGRMGLSKVEQLDLFERRALDDSEDSEEDGSPDLPGGDQGTADEAPPRASTLQAAGGWPEHAAPHARAGPGLGRASAGAGSSNASAGSDGEGWSSSASSDSSAATSGSDGSSGWSSSDESADPGEGPKAGPGCGPGCGCMQEPQQPWLPEQ